MVSVIDWTSTKPNTHSVFPSAGLSVKYRIFCGLVGLAEGKAWKPDFSTLGEILTIFSCNNSKSPLSILNASNA